MTIPFFKPLNCPAVQGHAPRLSLMIARVLKYHITLYTYYYITLHQFGILQLALYIICLQQVMGWLIKALHSRTKSQLKNVEYKNTLIFKVLQ